MARKRVLQALQAIPGGSQVVKVPSRFKCQCRVPAGTSVCLCRSCHDASWGVHVFTSALAFDRHRRGPKGTKIRFQCHDPQECGLVLRTDRAYPYWGYPESAEKPVNWRK